VYLRSLRHRYRSVPGLIHSFIHPVSPNPSACPPPTNRLAAHSQHLASEAWLCKDGAASASVRRSVLLVVRLPQCPSPPRWKPLPRPDDNPKSGSTFAALSWHQSGRLHFTSCATNRDETEIFRAITTTREEHPQWSTTPRPVSLSLSPFFWLASCGVGLCCISVLGNMDCSTLLSRGNNADI
jgi:hypothetical protein